ncbi:hypothetical protein BB560_005993 [Smittium megazygosporum]|uniref:Uncharacterized protein n=1 Tax=Smittium megazygosporum TaxID=133381 RepID=A0A2T9YME6_9FUNG|nr:hypothetical protein BB560_005993 [Smittium megazygosporum]
MDNLCYYEAVLNGLQTQASESRPVGKTNIVQVPSFCSEISAYQEHSSQQDANEIEYNPQALSTNYFPELSNVSDKLADQNQVYEAQQVGFGSELTNTQTPSPNQVYSFNEIINNRYYSTDQQFWIDQGQPFGFDNGLGLNAQIKDNSLNSFDIGGCIGTNFDALFNEASSAKSSNKVSSSNISPEVPEAPYLAYQVTNIDKSLYLNDVNIYKTILTVFALGDYTESIGNGFSKVGQHNGEYLRHTNTAHFTSLKTRGRNTGSSPCIKKRSKNHKKNTRPKMAGRPLETNGALPIPRPQGIKKRFWAEEGIDTLGISFDNVTITRRMVVLTYNQP